MTPQRETRMYVIRPATKLRGPTAQLLALFSSEFGIHDKPE